LYYWLKVSLYSFITHTQCPASLMTLGSRFCSELYSGTSLSVSGRSCSR